MDFELDQDHRVLRDTLRDFVKAEIRPRAIDIDEQHRIPDDLIAKYADMGLLGSYIPESYGGAGLDILSYAIVVEEVSKACASSGVLISAHTSLACDPILHFGTEGQKKRWLPDLAAGRKIGAILLTEAEAGSDLANVQTTYRREGEGFVIDGSKVFITNGGFLGTGVVLASRDRSQKHRGLSAFIVDLSSPGVTALRNESKMGIRGSYTTAFALDSLRVPADALLGEEGKGFRIAMASLDGGRIGIAAQALGIAGGALERSIAYSKERKQFGHPISALQAIQFKLADMALRVEASRLLVWQAACRKDAGLPFSTESAMAKLHAAETAVYVTREAVQIHGGNGYVTEYEVERMYRDAKITEIYEGTSEVQHLVIARALLS
ncbi:MAG: acyl-CoA dehydrogenase family protein [Rectinemataceae bacterium]